MASGVILGKMLGSNSDPQTATNTASIAALTARIDNRDQKDSVRAASLTNLTLVGTQTVDGVALVAGNRVGVMGQTLGQANGIYVVAAGAWTRATDADTSAKVTDGMFFFVEEGTVNAGKAFELTTPNPITLGTTVLTFAHFAGSLKTSEVLNDSSVVGTTDKDALNTLQAKVGAANLAAYGTLGPAANDMTDALNELASWAPGNCQLSFSRPNSNTATFNHTGGATTGALGTVTARTVSDTGYLTRRARVGAISATPIGSTAGVIYYTGGSPAGLFNRNAGFQCQQQCGLATVVSDLRWLMGILQPTTLGINDPAALLNFVGIGCGVAGDVNVQLYTNDGSGTATKVDLGASFPARTAGTVYDLWLGCLPAAGTIYYRVRRLDVPAIFAGSISADLPAIGGFFYAGQYINNNNTGSAVELACMGQETAIPL